MGSCVPEAFDRERRVSLIHPEMQTCKKNTKKQVLWVDAALVYVAKNWMRLLQRVPRFAIGVATEKAEEPQAR